MQPRKPGRFPTTLSLEEKMSLYERMLLVFSVLIFAFATHESFRHLRTLKNRVARAWNQGSLQSAVFAKLLALAAVSAGPAGYYGLNLWGELVGELVS
jgi:hypothetical protein